jgi:hypothetical protein
MENRAHSRPSGAPRRSQASADTSGAPKRPARVMPLLTAEETEGAILRIAGCLADDAGRNPSTRATHQAYVTGAIALATTLGVLSDARGVQVLAAAVAVFDGVATADPKRLAQADPAFAALVAAVRKNKGASLRSPLAMAQLSPAVGTAKLGRLMSAGIVGPADLTGFHPVIAGEC